MQLDQNHRASHDTRETVPPPSEVGSASAAAPSNPRPNAQPARSTHAENFSQIVAVMMRDRNFRKMRLADLEWLLLPPLLAGHWRMGKVSATPQQADAKAGVALVPATVALWARVSPAVDERLSTDLDTPPTLAPNEWSSGEIPWLIAIAGDPRAMPRFLVALRDREFKGRNVKLRSAGADGKAIVSNLFEYIRAAKL